MKKLSLLIFLVIVVSGSYAQSTYEIFIKKADSLAGVKNYRRAGEAYSAAFKLNKYTIEPDDRYNAACAWAKAGNVDSAFNNLSLIVGITYFNYDQINTDHDLDTLRNDRKWQLLINKIKQAKLDVITTNKLYQDFDLIVSALKEAHTGLYWYNTRPQFDSICMAQRAKIKTGMNTLGFYNIVAPVIGFIKEGHTFLRLGAKAQAWARFSGTYFPFYIKFLSGKAYIINNVGSVNAKGLILTAVDGHSMTDMLQKFMSYEPADGFNTTSKYRWIEQNGNFSTYYLKCYPQTKYFNIEVQNPATGNKTIFHNVPAVNFAAFNNGYVNIAKAIPGISYNLPATLQTDTNTLTAILTFNTFNRKRYAGAGIDFHSFVKSAFEQIAKQKINHLIIDIRKNGGGTEGYEDYLLSFLIDKDYTKYTYVQASAFSYSFYAYTDYKKDWQNLNAMLTSEHYLAKDGRILRKPGVEEHEKPQKRPFKGDLYILTSGLTYSGGAEFASLAKNYTNAIFIGEEVGGGYYGNTSGNRITLKLPNSKLEIGIPILKFLVNTPKETEPFGHGVLPDHEIQPTINQFLNGYDTEIEFTKKLINEK